MDKIFAKLVKYDSTISNQGCKFYLYILFNDAQSKFLKHDWIFQYCCYTIALQTTTTEMEIISFDFNDFNIFLTY